MSGVVGLYHTDGRSVGEELVRRMVDAMLHRGPDGVGVWREGAVGLGHLMLHTTPESLHERLPTTNGAGTLTITADLRIDNREELIARLRPTARADVFTDSDLVLAAYEAWGEDCVERLVGAFAFAVWDGPRRRLFCARDHLGVKNLYYWHDPRGTFACATEIKALLSLPGLEEEVDEVQLGTFLTKELLDPERTVFRGVLRLLSGHTLSVSPEGLRTRRYWAPAPTAERLPTTDEGYAERFLELFRDAVRSRLRSAFPVGSELSGGLDSSFVSCVARDLTAASTGGAFPTVSLVYDRFPQADERPFINDVIAQGGLDPHFVTVEENSLLGILSEVYDYLDDGRAAGNHHLNWLTASAAKRVGLRVLLSGQDGDTTVYHGWQSFLELAREEDWDAFAREATLVVRNLGREQEGYEMQETFRDPRHVLNAYGGISLRRWAVRGNYVRFARSVNAIHRLFGVRRREIYRSLWRDLVQPRAVVAARRHRNRERSAHQGLPPFINPDLARRIDLGERLAEHRSSKPEDLTVRGSQLAVFNSPHLAYSFEKFEHYTAAHGVEARHPFMDRRLVEYCLALPREQSMSEGWTRVVMRRAMAGIVPDSVRWRVGKASLAAPYAYLLVQRGGAALTELIASADVAAPFLDIPYVKGLYDRRDTLSDTEVGELGSAASLILWLRKRAVEA